MEDYARRAIPAGRWGTPEDVGRMVAFLAGPAGDWITGQIFVVDGGASLAGGVAQIPPARDPGGGASRD
jgi:NAD(P)-dependent dehydrogenase (short-subunit alcohol dehydrogenase family)